MEVNTQPLSEIAYFIVDIPSHSLPFLGYLTHLKSQGLNFDLYCPTNYKDMFGALPQNIFEFKELSWRKEGLAEGFLTAYDGFLKTIPAVEALWEEKQYKPKLIIADMLAAIVPILTKKYEIPLVVLHSNYFMLRSEVMSKEIAKIERDESLIPLEKQVEEKYGVQIRTGKDIFIEGDRNVSCLPKFVGEMITPPDDNFVYIGPGFRDEDDASALAINDELLKDNDIIYVSLGTSPTNILGDTCYDSIIEALKDTEYKVIISAMGKAEELIAKGVPKNIVVKSWVPQLKVLEHSKLFISHVGAGGFMEALSKGVPIIAAPITADQPITASVVEALGLGKWLQDKTPESIKKTVEEVLRSDAIKENCKKFKELINPKASKEAFAGIIKSYIK